MNKEQSVDDPSVDLIRIKNMPCTISMSYPDVVIACIEHEGTLWKHSGEQLRQRWWRDNNAKSYSLVVD